MKIVRKLFVGIPCQGGFSVEFNGCLVAFMRSGIPATVSICKSPGVGISRNSLTADFLATDAEKMLMIDSDILFSASDVARISSHEVPLVGGMYAKKEKQGRACLETFSLTETRPDEGGLLSIRYVGTGFMCVTRELITEMIQKYPEIEYREEKTNRIMHDFWTVGVHPELKRYLTEDWWFCQRTLDLGHKVYADSQVMLQHEGRAIYPLELNET